MIKIWNGQDEYEQERDDVLSAVDSVCRSGQYILGESVKNFESEFASYCGVRHGIGVGNATDGLFLALTAMGVGPGDEVITVANTAVPTVAAITATGAVACFVDIDPDTYLLDCSVLESAITSRTKCIVPVHLFGQCVDMGKVNEIAQRHSIAVLEDCSQSHGARHRGRRCGSMSTAAVFSFYPTKPLGCYGDGGMVLTNDDAFASHLRVLRQYGMSSRDTADELGYNSRLDELQAEILRRKLSKFDHALHKRRLLAKRYDNILRGTSLKLPVTAPHNEHVFYTYVCRHPLRDRIIEELDKRDIHLLISYRHPIHTMPAYRHLAPGGSLPHTERASAEIFSLPLYPSLAYEQQDEVCRSIAAVLGEVVQVQ